MPSTTETLQRIVIPNPAFPSEMLTQQFQFQIGAQRNVTDYQFNQKESISLRQNNGTDPRTNISPFLGQIQVFSSSEGN